MYQRKKKARKKILIIIVLLFLFFILITVTDRNNTKIEKVTKDLGVYIESILIPKMENYHSNLIDGINKELEEENIELKKMLELDSDHFQFIHATVVERNIDWYQEITINKGEKDGIQVDMAVISNQGLIGRISKTGNYSSVVKLLTSSSNDMKIAVDIKTQTETIHGIIDDYLESESVIQVNNIPKEKEINLEDFVYTNGLGGIYPSGIYIGKVVEINYDNLGLNKIVKVKPDISYDKLRYVSVVDRRNLE